MNNSQSTSSVTTMPLKKEKTEQRKSSPADQTNVASKRLVKIAPRPDHMPRDNQMVHIPRETETEVKTYAGKRRRSNDHGTYLHIGGRMIRIKGPMSDNKRMVEPAGHLQPQSREVKVHYPDGKCITKMEHIKNDLPEALDHLNVTEKSQQHCTLQSAEMSTGNDKRSTEPHDEQRHTKRVKLVDG